MVSSSCSGCVCTSPQTCPPSGRLLLATQVGHTATALRSLALRQGQRMRELAPGLLSLDTADVDGFLASARDVLSSVEAAEVRCLVQDASELPDVGVLGQALTAPTLAAAGARAQHADLLPLFDDEPGCFHSVYQPIVHLDGGATLGYEALLRATTPTGTPVGPDVLFPAAEAAGWVHLVDRVGRTTALRDAGPWLGPDELLFINFIPTSIYRPEVCLRTTEIAARDAGIRLDQVVFEVTEGHEVRDLDHLEDVFNYYRANRCQVALDDVGAGYSSLNLLLRLQPDIVKLDKDIVQALPGTVAEAVVSAIVGITHAYGGRVLAECVETAEQAAAARALGVDLGQGWFFGRPERRTPPRTRRPSRSAAGGTSPQPRHAVAPDPSRPDPAVAVPAPRRAAVPTAGAEGMSSLLLRAVQESVSGVVVADVRQADQPLVYVNPAFEAMTGYSALDVLGSNCRLLQGPDTDPARLRALSQAVQRGEQHQVVLRNYRKDGSGWWNELNLSPVRDQYGQVTHYLGYQHDVTARVEAEERLARQATQDSLTGLSNRSHLFDRLTAALDAARQGSQALGVLFVDLDGFKAVNDTHGHAVGDSVLVQVAERLRAALRSCDVLCRNGGDEFVALIAPLDPWDAERVCDRTADDIRTTVRRPFAVPGGQAQLGASVGVALFPEHAGTPDGLLKLADQAMYRQKHAEREPRTAGPVAGG